MTVEITAQPTGDVYGALLCAACRHCPTFSLVWREDIGQGPAAHAVAAALAPWLESEVRANEWPGTRMVGEPVPVRRYRLTDEALAVLLEAPGLYAWEAPARPEDLAFYADGGVLWLGSIAHEAAAWFGPGAPSGAELRASIPGLVVSEV